MEDKEKSTEAKVTSDESKEDLKAMVEEDLKLSAPPRSIPQTREMVLWTPKQ